MHSRSIRGDPALLPYLRSGAESTHPKLDEESVNVLGCVRSSRPHEESISQPTRRVLHPVGA